MGTIGYALAGVLGAGALAAAVYWIRRALSNSVALDQRDAALQVEKQHVTAMEAAAEAQRATRAKEFADRNDQVRTADDAAALLRDSFN